MESVIKWQTGEPKEEGVYIVTLKGGDIRCAWYYKDYKFFSWRDVIAWCLASEIEPYKE